MVMKTEEASGSVTSWSFLYYLKVFKSCLMESNQGVIIEKQIFSIQSIKPTQ